MDQEAFLRLRNKIQGFNQHVGIVITSLEEGKATTEVEVKECHINPIGSVHGGMLYSLADTTGGVAASSYGSFVTTVSGEISYLNPAIGVKKLIGKSRELKVGKTIMVYDVDIFDENEKLLATARMTYYSMHKKIVL